MKSIAKLGFKETEIGLIPEEWKLIKLTELIDIKHGFAFKGEFFSDEETPYVLLTPGNFKVKGGFNNSKYKYYNGEIPEDYVLKKGDIIVTMTDLSKEGDTLGYSAKVPFETNKTFLHNQRLGLVIFKSNEVYPDFLYWKLRNYDYRHWVLATSTGTTVKHTSPSRILGFEFAIPTITEQKSIANFLSALDDKIELNLRINQTLEEIGRAIFKHWFVDFEFPDEQGRPYKSSGGEMVDSELGEIPKGWEVGNLGSICNITMGQSPKSEFYNEENEGLPFHQGVTDFNDRFPTHRMYCTAEKKIAENKDVLLSVRAPVGRINIANTQIVIGRGLCAIKHKKCLQSFLFYLLKHIFSEEDSIGSGTVFNAVNKKELNDLKVLVPKKGIDKDFDDLIKPLDQKIEILTVENVNLSQIRDSLLPKLMSGKIRLLE